MPDPDGPADDRAARDPSRGPARDLVPGAYDRFAPRRARVVSLVLAIGVLVLCAWLAFFVVGRVEWWDRAGFLAVGAAIAVFLQRQASVRADPSPRALRVRNLGAARTVPWEEIDQVRWGGGLPWVQLDLADGETLGVMAVQRADGAFADAEAARLATLAAAHGRRGP